MSYHNPSTPPRKSATFDDYTLAEIGARRRPGSTTSAAAGRSAAVPHFDDLLFLGASISRYPLEGYRERCDTTVTLGTRFAKKLDHAQDPGDHRGHELRRAVGRRRRRWGAARPSPAPRPPPATAA